MEIAPCAEQEGFDRRLTASEFARQVAIGNAVQFAQQYGPLLTLWKPCERFPFE
jgi:hypothetical protein